MEIVYIDEPFKIQDFPLKKVYVLDNWLAQPLHYFYDNQISCSNIWSKTNQVGSNSSTGLPHHSFWGAGYFRGENFNSLKAFKRAIFTPHCVYCNGYLSI